MTVPGLAGMHPQMDSPIAIGTIGWDSGEYFDAASSDNDGSTLVHVQLFRGRDPSKTLDHSQAQGQKLLCKLAGCFFRIPPLGTQVLVAIPEPFGMIPGGSVVLCALDNAGDFLSGVNPGEVKIGTPGGQSYLFAGKSSASAVFDSSNITLDSNGAKVVGSEVDLGTNPTDGIVCDSIVNDVFTQMAAWVTAVGAAFAAMSAVGGISPPTTAAVASALANPTGSTTCKVTL